MKKVAIFLLIVLLALIGFGGFLPKDKDEKPSKDSATTQECAHENVVEDEAVDATCTTPGLTAGSHCTACGEVIVKQEEVPAGHTYGEWTVDVAATCTTEGSQKRVCTACGNTETEVIPADGGHVDADNDNQCDVCDMWQTEKMTEVAVETGELVAGNWYRMYYITSGTADAVSIRLGDGNPAFIAYGNTPGYESNYIFKYGPLYTLEGFEAVFGDGYIDVHMVEGTYNLMKDGVVVPEQGSVIIDSTTTIIKFDEGTVFRLV